MLVWELSLSAQLPLYDSHGDEVPLSEQTRQEDFWEDHEVCATHLGIEAEISRVLDQSV